MAPPRPPDGLIALVHEALAQLYDGWKPDSIVRYLRDNRRGLAAAVLLHALVLLLLLIAWPKPASIPQPFVPPSLTVDVVRLAPETTAPPAPVKSAMPTQRATRIYTPLTTSPKPATGTAPDKTRPEEDDLDAKLRGLARLRQPLVPLQAPDNAATADADATSDGAVPGDSATYSLRDYVRAQVERRWSLDLSMLANRNLTILLRVEMTRTGVILKSEIVDQARFKTDAAFHQIALSARNAVTLSSPISLPPGDYRNVMDFTLRLNPRDTLR